MLYAGTWVAPPPCLPSSLSSPSFSSLLYHTSFLFCVLSLLLLVSLSPCLAPCSSCFACRRSPCGMWNNTGFHLSAPAAHGACHSGTIINSFFQWIPDSNWRIKSAEKSWFSAWNMYDERWEQFLNTKSKGNLYRVNCWYMCIYICKYVRIYIFINLHINLVVIFTFLACSRSKTLSPNSLSIHPPKLFPVDYLFWYLSQDPRPISYKHFKQLQYLLLLP